MIFPSTRGQVHAGQVGDSFRTSRYIVGSLRRQASQTKDIDILIVLPDSAGLIGRKGPRLLQAYLVKAKRGDRCRIASAISGGSRRRSFYVEWEEGKSNGTRRTLRIQVDLFSALRKEFPYAMLHHTGSATFNIRVRAKAKSKGYLLNQEGLYYRRASKGKTESNHKGPNLSRRRRGRGSTKLRTEKQLLRFLGVTYKRPEERDK